MWPDTGNESSTRGKPRASRMSFTNAMEDIILTEQSKDISRRGEGQSPLTAFFGEPISVYTRQQAIEDGVLVDVSAWAGTGPEGMLGGFLVPVAITRALWDVTDLGDGEGRAPVAEARWRALARQHGESTRGRAHDVLWMAAVAARRSSGANRIGFLVVMTTEGKGGRLVRERLTVEAVIDGDGVTIGFPEDF